MTDKAYWKTTITITFLTDTGPLPDGASLGEVEAFLNDDRANGAIEWNSRPITEKEMEKEQRALKYCECCRDYLMPGLFCPAEFSDREDSKDGKVFVTACDECRVYADDVEAAEALSEVTGWPVKKSYDWEDAVSAQDRKVADREWYRPYFDVTLKEASEKTGKKKA